MDVLAGGRRVDDELGPEGNTGRVEAAGEGRAAGGDDDEVSRRIGSDGRGLPRRLPGDRGELSAEDRQRMNEVAQLFGVDAGSAAARNLALVPSAGTQVQEKAS